MRSLSLSEQKSAGGIGIQGFVQSNGGLADARFFRVWIALWVAFWPELRHFCPMAPQPHRPRTGARRQAARLRGPGQRLVQRSHRACAGGHRPPARGCVGGNRRAPAEHHTRPRREPGRRRGATLQSPAGAGPNMFLTLSRTYLWHGEITPLPHLRCDNGYVTNKPGMNRCTEHKEVWQQSLIWQARLGLPITTCWLGPTGTLLV